MRRTILTLAAFAVLAGAAACNTVRGAGDDVKSASNAVDNAM